MPAGGKKVFKTLEKKGVVADWREPDVIRFAPVPLYNTFGEVFQFYTILKRHFSMSGKQHIAIAGAGLVGSLASIYLARRGYRVSVFERRPDMRKGSDDAGKSINLALSTRGLRALAEVGLAEEIRRARLR